MSELTAFDLYNRDEHKVMRSSRDNREARTSASTTHQVARDIAMWLGLTSAVDRVADAIRGFTQEEVIQVANGQRSKILQLISRVDRDYEAHMEKYSQRIANMPQSLSANIRRAVQQETAKLRNEATEVRENLDDARNKLVATQDLISNAGQNEYTATRDVHDLMDAADITNQIEQRLNQGKEK